MNSQDKDSLAAAYYVLGITDAQTRQQLDKRLDEDGDFALEVLRWQKAFSIADVATQDVIPSSSVWAKIESDLDRNYLATKSPSTRMRPIHWAGWALAAALAGVIIFTDVIKPEKTRESFPIAILNGMQPNAQFVVSMDRSGSTIQVSSLGVTLPQNKSLQLWMIKGNSLPRSLGIINRSDNNTFRLLPDMFDNQTVLAISLEPVGGSKQAGPSGPVVFQGKVTTF